MSKFVLSAANYASSLFNSSKMPGAFIARNFSSSAQLPIFKARLPDQLHPVVLQYLKEEFLKNPSFSMPLKKQNLIEFEAIVSDVLHALKGNKDADQILKSIDLFKEGKIDYIHLTNFLGRQNDKFSQVQFAKGFVDSDYWFKIEKMQRIAPDIILLSSYLHSLDLESYQNGLDSENKAPSVYFVDEISDQLPHNDNIVMCESKRQERVKALAFLGLNVDPGLNVRTCRIDASFVNLLSSPSLEILQKPIFYFCSLPYLHKKCNLNKFPILTFNKEKESFEIDFNAIAYQKNFYLVDASQADKERAGLALSELNSLSLKMVNNPKYSTGVALENKEAIVFEHKQSLHHRSSNFEYENTSITREILAFITQERKKFPAKNVQNVTTTSLENNKNKFLT